MQTTFTNLQIKHKYKIRTGRPITCCKYTTIFPQTQLTLAKPLILSRRTRSHQPTGTHFRATIEDRGPNMWRSLHGLLCLQPTGGRTCDYLRQVYVCVCGCLCVCTWGYLWTYYLEWPTLNLSDWRMVRGGGGRIPMPGKGGFGVISGSWGRMWGESGQRMTCLLQGRWPWARILAGNWMWICNDGCGG